MSIANRPQGIRSSIQDWLSGQGAAGGGSAPPATVPAAPTLSFTPASGQLTVVIVDGFDGGSPITGHTLWFSTVNGFTPGGGNLYGPVSNGTVIGGLSGGTTYYGILIATNAIGPSANSAQASNTPSAVAFPSLANIVGRWRTDSITPQADGTAFTGNWVDSINGRILTQATGASQPLYKTNRYGGQPALFFDGTNDYVASASTPEINAAITAGEYTIMVIYGRTQTGPAFGFMFSATNSTGLNITNTGVNAGELSLGILYPYTGTGFSTGMKRTTQTYPATTGPDLPASHCIINGSIIGKSASGAIVPTNVGVGASATGVGPYKGEIQEIIVWNTWLPFNLVVQAERAARDYYGQAYPWTSAGFYYAALGDSITTGFGLSGISKQWPGNLALNTLGLGMGGWSNFGVTGASPTFIATQAAKENMTLARTATGTNIKYSYVEFYNAQGSVTVPVSSSAAVTVTQSLLTTLKSTGDKVAFGDTWDFANRGASKGLWTTYWAVGANQTGYMDLYVPISANANVGLDLACPNAAPYGLYFANEVGAATANATSTSGSNQLTINSTSVGTVAANQTLITATLGFAAGTTILSIAAGVATMSAIAGAGFGTGSIHFSGGDGVHIGDGGALVMPALFAGIATM